MCWGSERQPSLRDTGNKEKKKKREILAMGFISLAGPFDTPDSA
jgi:hypothetical protein